MTTRRTRRRAAPDRTPLIAGSAVLAVLVAGAAPFAAIQVARSRIAADPCAGSAASGAPSQGFYSAVGLLDRLSALPAVGPRAAGIAREATTRCADVWVNACSAVLDPAVEAARAAQEARLGLAEGTAPDASVSWRDHVDRNAATELCGAWSRWASWIDGHGLDAAEACPVCASE